MTEDPYNSASSESKLRSSLAKSKSERLQGSHQAWRQLAHSKYDALVKSEDSSRAHLFDEDRNVRLAAIDVCGVLWNSSHPDFISACQRIALADPDIAIRVHAIGALGKALRDSRDLSVSQFLADLARNADHDEVCLEAYWALRELQFGVNEEDNIRRGICLAKSLWRDSQVRSALQETLQTALGPTEPPFRDELLGAHPASVWDSAEKIDWEFVDRFSSKGVDMGSE